MEEITVRLDKGFFAERIVRVLHELEVSFLLKVPNHTASSGTSWERGGHRSAPGDLPEGRDGVDELRHPLGRLAPVAGGAACSRPRSRGRARDGDDADQRGRLSADARFCGLGDA